MKMKFNKIKIEKSISGILLVFLFILITSGREVYVGHIVQQANPYMMIFTCFTLITILFSILLIFNKNEKQLLSQIKANTHLIIGLNITTAICWISSFYALQFIEPSIENTINTAIGPFITIVIGLRLQQSISFKITELICAIAIMLMVIFMMIISAFGVSGIGISNSMHLIIGFCCCLFAGLSIVGNTIYSKKLSLSGMQTIAILATRFYLVLIISLIGWFMTASPLAAIRVYIIDIIVIALVGIALPLYLLQKGIEKSEPITVSFVMVLGPVVTYILQLFDHRLTLSLYTLIGILSIVTLVTIGTITRYKRVS